MRDQAFQLRNLVNKANQRRQQLSGPRPKLVVAMGGKGGVGTTTIAVNAAVAMSLQGARVVLVDAGMYRADVATMCGLTERRTVADVLTARNDIHEILERGPGGLLVVPGLWAPESAEPTNDSAQQRLVNQLANLGDHADLVVVDTGSSGPMVRKFCEVADEILIVTTPDNVAVMDSYATIKTLLAPLDPSSMKLVVNQVQSAEAAQDVSTRIGQSCQKFLNLDIELAGWIPTARIVNLGTGHQPLVIEQSSSLTALAITKLAMSLAAVNSSQTNDPNSRRAAA
ncbi:MAG: flagellar biosynthesis protein FlhG [Pirellulaceae bacterium]|jgi:flagellar biosynthesis protein FlhG